MSIKAIETKYKGYRFRSRLEARWAVFFDALGIEWEYEKEGYQLNTGERYLPDFYLPDTKTWVEVKGVMSADESTKLGRFLDWGCPLPHFTDSYAIKSLTYPQKKELSLEAHSCPGMIILGDIPTPQHGFYLHKFITHYKGLRSGFMHFNEASLFQHGVKKYSDDELNVLRCFRSEHIEWDERFNGDTSSESEAVKFFNPTCIFIPSVLAYPKVTRAYIAARSARFEFGEPR